MKNNILKARSIHQKIVKKYVLYVILFRLVIFDINFFQFDANNRSLL